MVHLHAELESATLVLAVAAHRDLTPAIAHNALANGQTQADTLDVHVVSALDLAKLPEEHAHLPIVDTLAGVDDVDD